MPERSLDSLAIRNIFRQPLPPVEVTRGYTTRLAAVLCGLVVLQLAYLLLIATVVAFTLLYAQAVTRTELTVSFLTIVIYAGPPIAGGIVTVFLLKPLIIRPPRPPEPLQLTRQQEPMLFEFLDHLCRALHSPRPSRVFVDLRVNASAAVRGWRGFFLGQIDLTIGLPLAVGLTLPQFTGVLAHEFGHFSQHAGLRSYFLIQTIQNWFSRVVHQRDKMDAWLDHQLGRRDWRVKSVAAVAKGAVDLSRKYLAFLTRAGAWISAAFSRQMEFDADRWETAIVGVDAFEETSRQLPLLEAGLQLAWQDVSHGWSVSTFPENVADLALARKNYLPEEIAEEILSGEMTKKTGKWDTHPCLPERTANARATGFSGIFHLAGSTEMLFQDLPAICRDATMHHYRNILQLKMESIHLIPISETIANAQAEREYEHAVQTLFGTTSRFCARWFRLPSAEPRVLPDDTTEWCAPKLDAAAYDAALQTNLNHFAALVMRQSGIAVNPASFNLPAGDFDTVQRLESTTSRNMNLAFEENRRATARLAARIEGTLARILNQELALAISVDRCSSIPDFHSAWRCYSALSQWQDEIADVRGYDFALRVIRANARVIPAAICANLIEDLENRSLEQIQNIIAKVAETPTTVQLDPKCPSTISGQLECRERSHTDRIEEFLFRSDVILSRALGQLAWTTLAACPIPRQEPSSEPSADMPGAANIPSASGT